MTELGRGEGEGERERAGGGGGSLMEAGEGHGSCELPKRSLMRSGGGDR